MSTHAAADGTEGRMPANHVLSLEERGVLESNMEELVLAVRKAGYHRSRRHTPEEEARLAIFHGVSREILRREGLIRDGRAVLLQHHSKAATTRYLANLIVETAWPVRFSRRERLVLNLHVETKRGITPPKSHRFLQASVARKAALHLGRMPSPEQVQEIIEVGISTLFIYRTQGKANPRCTRRPALAEFFAVVAVRTYFSGKRLRTRMVVASSDTLPNLADPAADSAASLRAAMSDSFDAINRRLSRLSRQAAEVFALHIRHHLNFKTIAAMLRTTAGRISRLWTEWVMPVAVGILSAPAELGHNIRTQLAVIRVKYPHIFDAYVIEKRPIERIARDLELSVVDVRRMLSKKIMPITLRTIAAQEEVRDALRATFAQCPDAKQILTVFHTTFVLGLSPLEACAKAKITSEEYRNHIGTTIQPALLAALR